MKQNRNIGIDVLRILATIMVIILHLLSQGGVLKSMDHLSIKGETMWFLEIACFCAVNCFGLISGYVGVKSRHKISSIINLWLQVVFYSLIISIIQFFVLKYNGEKISIIKIFQSFFPILTNENWYFSSYFCLFFFTPVLNYLIKSMAKKQLEISICSGVILFSIMETITTNLNFGINVGYSFLWLAFLYVIGGYISTYDPFKKISKFKNFMGYISCVSLTFISKIIIAIITQKIYGEPLYTTKFITYVSPLMLLSAIFLVNIFSKLEVNDKFSKIILFMAPMTFGVYIIHTNKIIYSRLLLNSLSNYSNYNVIILLIIVLSFSLIIYVLCSLIDWIRKKLFIILHIKKIVSAIELLIEKVKKRLFNDSFNDDIAEL